MATTTVLKIYHDQGRIAMKLMDFERGVTLLGGFPFPICMPARGTAYEIEGRGVTNLGATRAAVLLAGQMARRAAIDVTYERWTVRSGVGGFLES